MIKVLHVIDTGGPGGAETVFLNSCAGLDPQRFRSVCVVSRDGWLASSLRDRGLTPVIAAASGSFQFGYLRQLVDIVRRERIDIIAAHLYGSAVYGSMAGLLTRRPVVCVLHGQSDLAADGRFDWAKRLLVKAGSRALVFVSDRLKGELARALGVSDARCHVIPNGIDIARFGGPRADDIRRQLGLTDAHVLVGAVGNIRRPKSYDVLLQAAHILHAKSARYRFVIAGEGGNSLERDLLAQRRELGLDEVVTFLGLRKDVARLMRNLDVYALSSTTEGFSLACIEAMASGIPVVATRCGGPEEIIDDDMTGLLVPIRDPQALAAAIHRLAEDREFATLLTQNAARSVESRYALSTMIASYEHLFTRLVANRQPDAR